MDCVSSTASPSTSKTSVFSESLRGRPPGTPKWESEAISMARGPPGSGGGSGEDLLGPSGHPPEGDAESINAWREFHQDSHICILAVLPYRLGMDTESSQADWRLPADGGHTDMADRRNAAFLWDSRGCLGWGSREGLYLRKK